MNRRNERQKGFTLIELLVVLIIIAVLAAVLVPALTSYVDDAREKKAVSEAQVCVTAATEWAAVQRTALISQAYQSNKPFADAYKAAADTAKWSTDYDALNTAAPTVTGTLALAEGDGQYFLRPESMPKDTTTDAMKDTVKTAAGVDGKLQKLQLNADGKVLYLLYTSAEGIPVAYTAAGTAQDPATTVRVATLPEDTTPPEPTEPDHSGDLVFCVKNEYTGEPVPGISFHVIKYVNNTDGEEIFSSQTTDKNGMVYFKLTSAELTNHFMQFKLVPDYWPEGYQQVFAVQFNIDAYKSDNDGPYDSYKMQANPVNINHNYNYKEGAVGTLPDGATDHLYTFYVRSVPTLELRVWDDDNGNYLNGVEFTLSNGTKSIPITSGLTNTVLDVKLHEKDNLRPGSENKCLDMSQYGNYAKLLVNFTKVPKGYQYFDNCYLEIKLENQPEHNWQLSTAFQEGQTVNGNQAHTKIECKDLPDKNKSIVTIHVKGGKTVNFCVYDGLDSVHTAQLPNATMKLCKQDGTEIETFTTDGNGAGNFTQTLSEGEYTLHLVSGTPSGYAPPADITFKVERVNGLLTLTGTGANASCVDNATSTVTMLVTKPNTKRIQLQVVDAITQQPWAGVNVKVTGDCLKATKEEKRNYVIDSSANNTHTFDLDLLESGNITVIIVGSDNKDSEFKIKYHNDSYTNNFVGSKFVFNLNKNEDGTVTLTSKNFNGSISTDGSTVLVYAYPKVNFDFRSNTAVPPEYAAKKGTLTVVTNPEKNPVITADTEKIAGHDTITPWEMESKNRNHSEGVPIGNYTLVNDEEHGWIFFEPKPDTIPWNFSVERDSSGFPVVKDKDGNILTDKTIVAWYNLLKTP
ncbi:SpaA isopeptide-forming pilin-related protein [uncultured Gemmiger sp.]|uniref:SpaA isopeptide-forming pilin-related protein n=1 Tax=uncultured Gemmiger sp. TaxID=1623490 RepID=UPI0025E17A9E|nr:SpaA isopeptide-forming pilin-related protein [uncultured Gemmiger sp.]